MKIHDSTKLISKLKLKHHASLFYEAAKDCMPEQLKNMLFVFGYGLKPPDFSATLTLPLSRRPEQQCLTCNKCL
ncbi:MAG: hypothetical protein KKG93_06095 [Bacteroidetes bacterium]|nr:hypothetical protein [Bacteroidota bacterium]